MPIPDLHEPARLSLLLEPLGLAVLSEPEPIGDDFGFASTRAAVRISVGGDPPVDAVVKAWDAVALGLGEVEFYSEWAGRLPIRLPACHAMDATDDYGLLVLEDLRPFRQGDELAPVSSADAIAIASAIGRAHTATVGSEAPLPPPRFGRLLPDDWHDSRRVAYVERWGLPEHDLVRAIVVHSQLAGRLARSLWLGADEGLTHSDLHLDNIVFRDEGPVIIDWARPGWGPAAHDLSSVLLSCSQIEDFEAVIEAHRVVAPTVDDEVDGAILQRLVTATLGIARWIPTTPRQERLIDHGRHRVREVADWLSRRRPGLVQLLRG